MKTQRSLRNNRSFCAGLALAAALLCLASARSVRAEAVPQRRSSAADAAPTAVSLDPMQEVTPEREAAAETFARLHHPELADLLSRLKKVSPAEYKNAVRDLFRESERFAKLKGRDPARYDMELELWKLGSRIHLVTARLVMADSDSLKRELEELVAARLDLRVQLQERERDKLRSRLDKLNAELDALASDRQELIAQDVDKLLRSARSKAGQTNRSKVRPNPRTSIETKIAPPSTGSEPAARPTPKSPDRPRAGSPDGPQT